MPAFGAEMECALQFQRRRFAEYWRRKWVPKWLGLQLGRIAPILFRWRERPTVKEAFKVRFWAAPQFSPNTDICPLV